MNHWTHDVAWSKDGEVTIGTARNVSTRRFRIEERTVYVLCEEKEPVKDDTDRWWMKDSPAVIGGSWTRNHEEIVIADTRDEAEAAMRRIMEREPMF